MRTAVAGWVGGVALLGAATAGGVYLGQDAGTPSAARGSAAAASHPQPAASSGALTIARSGLDSPRGRLFAAQGPAPALRSDSAAQTQANKPSPPSFPLKFAGWFGQGSTARTLYMTRGNEILPIRPGDVVDGFRIDTVRGERIEVTYVAGGEQMSILLAGLAGPGREDAAPAREDADDAERPAPARTARAATRESTARAVPSAPQTLAFVGAPGAVSLQPPVSPAPESTRTAASTALPVVSSPTLPPLGPAPPARGIEDAHMPSGTRPGSPAPAAAPPGILPAASGTLGNEPDPRAPAL